MKQSSACLARWLLFSDIHFKHHDLDRVKHTAQWIVTLSRRQRVDRVVICGDLLTSRTMQPTHVLSACYRFISGLSDAVPRINILLGNHDLAYKHDYQTTALDALNLRRLSPFVTVHSHVSSTIWDGRRVLLLPFREDQTELTGAIAALNVNEARETVAFAHLAINKAVTQRNVVGSPNSVTYHGLLGPQPFASLARTFTGHFHSHQTILQKNSDTSDCVNNPLQGSITYLGSPLQLTWADLHDEQRGVVLLDSETLEHELLVCPNAVGYITVDLQQVLRGEIDPGVCNGKHVMLLGDLTRFTYFTARDRLLAHGARSVRKWIPLTPVFHNVKGSFGASVPASDSGLQTANHPEVSLDDGPEVRKSPNTQPGVVNTDSLPQTPQLDLAANAGEYVESLKLERPLQQRLTSVGQRLLQISYQLAEGFEDDIAIHWESVLHAATQCNEKIESNSDQASTPMHVFVAKPRVLTLANFLGVQKPLKLDFDRDLQHGLTFLVGSNGSGKSTLVEAIAWCQFGRCIRSGVAASDVVNDVAGKDCRVSLEFENGYMITRYRKDKTNGNRVVVSLHGVPQTQFECADARTTQAAIDELLGIDYETFVRSVVLGQESAASFLHSTAKQRRDLIESMLGLSVLDRCGHVSRNMLRAIDVDISKLKAKLDELASTMEYAQNHLKDWNRIQKYLRKELEGLTTIIGIDTQGPENLNESGICDLEGMVPKQNKIAENPQESTIAVLEKQNTMATNEVQNLSVLAKRAELCVAFHAEKSALVTSAEQRLEYLKASTARIQTYNAAKTTNSITGWLLFLLRKTMDIIGLIQHQSLQLRRTTNASANRGASEKSAQRAKTHVFEFCLVVLRRFSVGLQKLENMISTVIRQMTMRQNLQDSQKLINDFEQNITIAERSLTELQQGANTEELVARVALDYNADEQDVRIAIATMILEDAKSIPNKLRCAIQEQAKLQKRLQDSRDALRKYVEQRKLLQQQMGGKRQEMAMYAQLVEKEQAVLAELCKKHDKTCAKVSCLSADRGIFAFWTSALAKKTKSASAATTTFREYLLEKSLYELNELMAQVLTVLYEDTRHAKEMTTGILRSLFEEEDVENGHPSSERTGKRKRKEADAVGALDKTLSIGHGLAYGKRSGGERKRIDLALFFALLHMSHARSRYRAHYLLVDEVFDSLDVAGQGIVVQWCNYMTARVSFVLVITHSQHLVSQGVHSSSEGNGDGGSHKVITAKMGNGGTEFETDGKRIGICESGIQEANRE